ncbi:MAG TPA: hypothetical protein VJC04_03410 [Candidatus Paceibacterota bacterium]
MKNLISIILIAAAIWIFWSYTDPIYKETKDLKVTRTDYQDKLAQANEFRQKYEDLIVAYQSFSEADIIHLSQLVPDTVDTVRLVMDVSDIAAKQGLLIKNIKINELSKEDKETKGNNISSSASVAVPPAGLNLTTEVVRLGSTGTGFNSIDLSFSVIGNYERFVAFLKDLEKSLRILDIIEIKFSAAIDDSAKKSSGDDFNLSLRTYWLK